ncbi:MAG: zinc-dependent peptidase [Desulfatibacillaceae bacterium]|nr:zinc-dependent peptidase [Desulfatibacillaceae bacterium]
MGRFAWQALYHQGQAIGSYPFTCFLGFFMGLLLIFGAVLLVLAMLFFDRAAKSRRRAALFEKPFPGEWQKLLEKTVPLYRSLPQELKAPLHGLVNIFLDEKNFEGAGGFVMTDSVRLTVAAQACMLLLGSRTKEVFPLLKSIVIYPGAYRVCEEEAIGDLVVKSDAVWVGESWEQGTLVLAWDQVEHEMANPDEATNVILHEFAHQLDAQNSEADGLPPMPNLQMAQKWQEVFNRSYEKLESDLKAERQTDLDDYGASNPAEFFAVATETFFQTPQKLKAKAPELYGLLALFYGLAPHAWNLQK